MRRTGIATILLAGLLGARLAHADFKVASEGATLAATDNPHINPDDIVPQLPRPRWTKRPYVSIIRVIGLRGTATKASLDGIVQGFGTAIPLSFACRQILPAGIHVTYGNGVDPSMPVSWTGGRPWAAIMRDALAPAGLKLIPQGRVVEIRR